MHLDKIRQAVGGKKEKKISIMAGLDKKQVFAVFGVWLKLSVDILKIHIKVHKPTISAICKKVKWQKKICTAGFFFHFQINRVSKNVVK